MRLPSQRKRKLNLPYRLPVCDLVFQTDIERVSHVFPLWANIDFRGNHGEIFKKLVSAGRQAPETRMLGCFLNMLAEREGFEPSVQVLARTTV